MSGYILESRTILDSAIWDKPPLYFKVWHYLLLKAQHADYKGLKRGQLITSIPEIQEACSYHVGYRKITPSKKEIYGIVKFLRNPYGGNDEGNNEKNMIVTTKVTHGLLVTICNYNVYQDPKYYEGNDEKSAKVTTKSSRRERQGNNINKNDKNDKNDKKDKNNTPLTPQGEMERMVNELPLELRGLIFDFMDCRKKMKKPFTVRALGMMLKKLNELSGGDTQKSKAIIEQSIINGWTGIFALDEKKDRPRNEVLEMLQKGVFDDFT